MDLARMAQKHTDCKRSKVGAVLVLPNGIVLLGTNGSPTGHPKCVDGGCYRCELPDLFPHGTGYDVCTCVHAEGRCLMTAARFGIPVEGGTVYSTLRPCRECSKHLLEAGIVAVYYEVDLLPTDPAQHPALLRLRKAI